MTGSHEVDVLVIGAGPAGEGAAMGAAKAGLRVAVVDRYRKPGGACTHWGTIPSKALRNAVHRLTLFQTDPLFAPYLVGNEISFPDLLRNAASVITKQTQMRRTFYDRNDVEMVLGEARLVDDHRIAVTCENGEVRTIGAAHIVIATGSRPYRPPEVDFNHPRIFDSDTILRLDRTPKSIAIYGAGVIGCEYTSIFRKMNCKVNLINTRDRLLDFLDDEIVDALAYHLRDMGVLIRHNEILSRIEPREDCVLLHLQSGKIIKDDVLLYAQGRTANGGDLGLEALGIASDERGRIDVDANFRTSLPHIYAVGDVVGLPSLASASYDQGRFAAAHIVDPEADHALVDGFPNGIYTSPEISSIGQTERELTAGKVPYEVGHSFFRSLARAQITGQTTGMLKILFHRETLAVLGVHCFGQNAAEIIHIGQAIMRQPAPNNSIEYFTKTTFNYPTMAEAYRVAALNGLNRVFS
ncbi:MAG: Si-specific NAD(P)(+) transhydrogenase [Planctomycetota bacterium]|nr:MAG: Si-specific NAD(P)(+) transhydrogenase [Planctomycetota bacterium]